MIESIDCPLCENRGYTVVRGADGWTIVTRECSCMAKRRTLRRLQASGLGDLWEKSSLKAFETPDEWTKAALEKAVDYCKNGGGAWFYVAGHPGTGKTHLCTGICRYLLKNGEEVRYMLWREELPNLKALVGDAEEYAARLDKLKTVPVLYIDDFFKGTVTDADKNLAFELINARYNRKDARTLFSSERPLKEIRNSIDPAISSRIQERARGYILCAPQNQPNWRERE